MVKAESLYNICDFEHALVLFTRGKSLVPDFEGIQSGILKCRKTILNKVDPDEVFFFSGSKHFIDYLRKQGSGAVEAFIEDDNTDKNWKKTFALVNLNTKKGNIEDLAQMMKSSKRVKIKEHNRGHRQDRMKKDKNYLKQLEKSLLPLSGQEPDVIRCVIDMRDQCYISFYIEIRSRRR